MVEEAVEAEAAARSAITVTKEDISSPNAGNFIQILSLARPEQLELTIVASCKPRSMLRLIVARI